MDSSLLAGLPPVLGLAAWLGGLEREPQPLVLLGGSGHLDLSPDEQGRVGQALPPALQDLAALPPATGILLLTGLAPGADLLLADAVAAWLDRHGRRSRHIGLLPVPVEVLWKDWLPRAAGQDPAAVRRRFEDNLRTCEAIVTLWDEGDAPDWSNPALRQEQYRRLSAVLAQQSDVLVAVLRGDHAGLPGGTGEVSRWRQQRDAIPAAFGSGARRHRSGWPHGDRMILIDPGSGEARQHSTQPWLQRAREALRAGNYLLCHDLAVKAAQVGQGSDALEYLRLLALANAGSTRAALRRLGELPAELRERDEDWLALAGRLHKDLGLLGGSAASGHFQRAARCYDTAYRRTGGYFSGINAATTALLGGEAARAAALATEVLRLLRDVTPADEAERYYLAATEAEAALLLGDTPRARVALERADALLPGDVNARSRTRRQLRRVCQCLNLDEHIVDALHLPPVIHLAPATPPDAEFTPAALTYAGITRPQELETAERALAQGARLHAVLAAPSESTVAHWHAAHGAAWAGRLRRLLEQSHEVSIALGFLPSEDRWCDAYVGTMALGLSRLAAQRLDCHWRGFGHGPEEAQETAAKAEPVEAAGLRFTRRFAGVIFADFAGFSRLNDEELPQFWALFMRAISVRLAVRRNEILLKQTWGDALHLVASTARAAAELACEIQTCVEELRPALRGGLQGLELRLAAHYAPVFAGHDPVEGAGTYFGTQLSFTARIEPVTPSGMIFVTEAFAARLALEAPDAFVLEYAGEVKLAKAYGQSRLFSLRPARAEA